MKWLSFLALSDVAPVTHAVVNTVEQVVIIIASVLVFCNSVSKLREMSSAISKLGAKDCSVAKSKCNPNPTVA